MACGRSLVAGGLMALAMTGCAAPGVPATGGARIMLPAARRIQYVSADVQSLQVTISSLATQATYLKTFPGSALVPAPTGSQFSYEADNLPPGSYTAKLEAFQDAGRTRSLGSISTSFAVTAFATTRVTMPSLILAATPVGDWCLTIGVTLSAGYVVSDYTSQLDTPGGGSVAGPAGTALGATNAFTWGDVVADPAGVSTSSMTVTATNKKGRSITKTQIATASIASGATVSSTVSFVFP